MAQVATTIRMDSELKSRFDELCDEFGMNINTAFNIFAKAVVRTRSIPFTIGMEKTESAAEKGRRAFQALRRQAARNGVELSLEEINDEIDNYRKGL